MDERRTAAVRNRPRRLVDVWVEAPTTGGAASLHRALRRAAIVSAVHLPRAVCVPVRGNTPFSRAAVLEVIEEWWRDAGRPDVQIEERDARHPSYAPLVHRLLTDARAIRGPARVPLSGRPDGVPR